MMGTTARRFTPVPAVSLEELVPADHFYRHVDRVLDLSFVCALVQDCYAVGLRDAFTKLDRSSLYRRRDDADAPADTPDWPIVCFYIGHAHRWRGVMAYLVRAAVEYVRERGGGIVEAYPRREPGNHFAGTTWAGLLPVFTAAGYEEVSNAPTVASASFLNGGRHPKANSALRRLGASLVGEIRVGPSEP